jgi:hypothetical protein
MAQVTVQRGDTLSKIAQRTYGDPNRWREIAQANGIRDPNKIGVGMTLDLPGMDTDQGRADAMRGRQAALKQDLATGGPTAALQPDSNFGKLHGSNDEIDKKIEVALRSAGWTTPNNSWAAPEGWDMRAAGSDDYKVLEALIGRRFAGRNDRRAVAEAFLALGLDPETFHRLSPEGVDRTRELMRDPSFYGFD